MYKMLDFTGLKLHVYGYTNRMREQVTSSRREAAWCFVSVSSFNRTIRRAQVPIQIYRFRFTAMELAANQSKTVWQSGTIQASIRHSCL